MINSYTPERLIKVLKKEIEVGIYNPVQLKQLFGISSNDLTSVLKGRQKTAKGYTLTLETTPSVNSNVIGRLTTI